MDAESQVKPLFLSRNKPVLLSSLKTARESNKISQMPLSLDDQDHSQNPTALHVLSLQKGFGTAHRLVDWTLQR